MQLTDFDMLVKAAQDSNRPSAAAAAKERLISEMGLDRKMRYGHTDLIRLAKSHSRRRWAEELGMTRGQEVLHPRLKGEHAFISRIDEDGYVILSGVRGRHDARSLHKAKTEARAPG